MSRVPALHFGSDFSKRNYSTFHLVQLFFEFLDLQLQLCDVAQCVLVHNGTVADHLSTPRKAQRRQSFSEALGCHADIGDDESFGVAT